MLSGSKCSGFEIQDQNKQVLQNSLCEEPVWTNLVSQEPERKECQYFTKENHDFHAIVRQRHNSSQKDHHIEFDLNSLPIENFQSVIEEELSLKEKGGRNSIQIRESHLSEDSLQKQRIPQTEMNHLAEISRHCESVCQSPSNSDLSTVSQVSEASAKLEVYTTERRSLQQPIYASGDRESSFISSMPSGAVEQYKAKSSEGPNISQAYKVETRDSQERFTSRLTLNK